MFWGICCFLQSWATVCQQTADPSGNNQTSSQQSSLPRTFGQQIVCWQLTDCIDCCLTTQIIWYLATEKPHITKTCLYNFDPFIPHFYIVKLGYTGVYIIFLISAQKHKLWVLTEAVLTSTHNLCFEQKYEKYQSFFIWKFSVFLR